MESPWRRQDQQVSCKTCQKPLALANPVVFIDNAASHII